MSRRLFIDVTKCDTCETCTVQCAYFYQPKVTEHGILALREEVSFMLTCRRCEEPSCVAACRFEALERQEDGVMKRYNGRCVGCKCCTHACPFGTIHPETVTLYAVRCDYCVGSSKGVPACVATCVRDATAFEEVEESPDEDIYVLNDHLAARSPKWDKKAV
ncbi:MAG: 4Fe-4S dicluster domain-containing protein [Candidatus Latescibacterota bacterium]